jgi:DNA-binding response OmpR family regulator
MNRESNNSKESILLVDDELYTLTGFTFYLKGRGFNLVTAEDGETGFEKAKNELPDLILLDVLMPEMDGFEVCRLLKDHEITKTIPVIFMTSLTEIDDISRAFSIGAVDYVCKPFQFEEVMARINAHLTIIKNTKRTRRKKCMS